MMACGMFNHALVYASVMFKGSICLHLWMLVQLFNSLKC